jgi:PAS domain S-box-containing protein
MSAIDFARVFEVLPSPHMLIDRDFRYVRANEAYLKVVGRTWSDLEGQLLFDLFPNPGEGGRRLKESLERVFANGEADTLAFLPYDITNAAGQLEVRYWSATHTPIRNGNGEVAYVMQNTIDVTEVVQMREAAALPYRTGGPQLVEKAREAEEAHQRLLGESEDFRRLFQQAPGFFAVLSGPQHVFTFSSDAYTRLIGGRQVIGRPLAQALPEVVEQGFVDFVDGVYRTGKTFSAEGARVMLQNQPGEPVRETFLDFSYDAIRAADGSITGVFVQGMDRTEAFKAQQRQRLLIDELNHRVKNALATVQSIAAQTLRAAPDIASARVAFEARLLALAKAHSTLSARQWEDADLESLVRQELAAYGADRFDVTGPSVMVNSKATIALALVLHELTTNAVKHGALSRSGGRISVSWRPLADGIHIDWVEQGGPPTRAPERRGFGSRLVSRVVEGELGGSLETRYQDSGFAASISIPVAAYERGIDAFAE